MFKSIARALGHHKGPQPSPVEPPFELLFEGRVNAAADATFSEERFRIGVFRELRGCEHQPATGGAWLVFEFLGADDEKWVGLLTMPSSKFRVVESVIQQTSKYLASEQLTGKQ